MSSKHVVEVTEANFQAEVLEYSRKAPVIIDFWATWCGPCRTLGPILEQFAESYRGAFRLAKVDVDQAPQLAAGARVQSIPTVVAVHAGAFVDQFIGALPRAEVKRFIDAVLERAGGTIQDEADEVPADPAAAKAHWEARLAKKPDDGHALLELGRLELRGGRLEAAREILERVEPSMDEYSAAQSALELVELSTEVSAGGGEAAVRETLAATPGDPLARFRAACADALHGRLIAALETVIDLVANGPADVRERAKSAARTILAAAGRDDPAVEAQRRRLAALLF